MPINPKRVEAAARAMMADPKLWDVSVESYRDEWRGRALDVLAAAFPEIASDPPTAWVAPWEATEEMWTITSADHWPAASWERIRDAHTKEQEGT